MDFPGRLIAGLLAIILLIVFPLQYIAGLNADRIDALVDDKTHQFSDSIREKGYLDIAMYEDYIDFLDSTGEIYELEIQDISPVKGEGVLETRGDSAITGLRMVYDSKLTAKPMSFNELKSFAAHTHMAACYAGNLHVCNGVDCVYPNDMKLVRIGLKDLYTGFLQYSTDKGNTWVTAITLPYETKFTDITYGNGIFVAFASDGSMYYSSNAINWTRKENTPATDRTAQHVVFRDGKFIAMTVYGRGFSNSNYDNRMYTSNDGLTWTSPAGQGSVPSRIITEMKLLSNGAIVLNSSNLYSMNFMSPTGTTFSESLVNAEWGLFNDMEYFNGRYYSGYLYMYRGVGIGGPLWERSNRYLFNVNSSYGYISNIINFKNKLYVIDNYGQVFDNATSPGFTLFDTEPIIYFKALSKLPSVSISYNKKFNITYDEEAIYIPDPTIGSGKTFTSTNLSTWTTKAAGTGFGANDSITKLIVNANGGRGPIDKGACIKIGKYYDSSGKEVQPICHTVVTSISATNPTQTVDKGNPIVTTATATYLDGHTGTVNCTSNYNANLVGTQTVTLTYTGLVGNAKTTGTRTCTLTVTVRETNRPSSLTVTASATTVYNGVKPTFTVVVNYTNGTIKTLSSSQYTETGWSSGPGTKTVTFSYTESSTTVTKSITITVKPNVSSLSVTASATTVYNGVKPTFTVAVNYENGTTATLSASQYTETGWSSGPGTKTVTFSYTENSKTVTKSITITVKPNVISLTVTPSSTSVYNGTEPTYTVKANYENNTSVTLSSSQYTKTAWTVGVGIRDITFTYTENNKTVTATVRITVNPWLNRIEITPASQNIPRYTEPNMTVTVYFANGTSRVLAKSEYTLTGLDNKKIATQTITATYSLNQETKTATASVRVTGMIKVCPKCKQSYELNSQDVDTGCPYCRELLAGLVVNPLDVEVTKGEALPITVKGIYNDGSKRTVTEWTSNYISSQLGLQIVTVQFGGYGVDITVWVKEQLVRCPICNQDYPTSEPKCPFCAEKVIRIEAASKNVTVMQYEPIPLTVTAFYADGSSRTVNDWSINRTSAIPGIYRATVSYKEVSDTINLTVVSISSMTCPICNTVYDLSEYPKGCPICSDMLVGIEAYLMSESNLVQLGSVPPVGVILIFSDEHRELVFENYTIEDYNPYALGVQTIRILYHGFSATLIIEVVNRLDSIICPNGHEYFRNSDGTDPGCPFCHDDEETSYASYYDITYTTEILDTMYLTGIYYFKKGNYVSIIVTKKNKSLMYRIQKTFFSTSVLGDKKRFIYGGEVL